MPAVEAAFIAKIREQIDFLQHEQYNYQQLRVYVFGIGRPWVFGPATNSSSMATSYWWRWGRPKSEGVPEYVFPLRHIVATELAISEG